MKTVQQEQGIVLDDYLPVWVDAFMMDRRAAGLSAGTIHFYQIKFQKLLAWCESRAITRVEQITPGEVRAWLLVLAEDHTPGGVHAFYRALRALLKFYDSEAESPSWSVPTDKVKAPKVPEDLLSPISPDIIKALLSACSYGINGKRDKAIVYTLLDTGARASELAGLDREDTNLVTGQVHIRKGKGGKGRLVYLGKDARRALRSYLRTRADEHPALFVTKDIERMSYWSLRDMIEDRAGRAGVKPPKLHGFRRTFAISCLRAGMDIYTLQRLMGHKDVRTLLRYLKLLDEDLQQAHARFSPGDRL